MNVLFDQILKIREVAALPSLVESGGLPALISGLGAVHRANLAAALRARTGRPLVVICPDETAAESFAGDLSAMLGEAVATLGLREFTFLESVAVSRGAELSLSGDITRNWTALAMYSFTKYTDRTVAPGNPGRDFERTPGHAFSLSTSYRFDCCDILRDVVVGGGYRFRSKSYGTMRGQFVNKNVFLAPSHVFDINVSMPLSKFGGSENWTLTLGVRNLFGEKYFESARHWYESLVGEPRTFEIGLRARF